MTRWQKAGFALILLFGAACWAGIIALIVGGGGG